jgi:hypothetical protein
VMSPAGDRLLVAFDRTLHATLGSSLDGLGGFLLVDATTLAAVRPAIRMGYRRALCAAWRDDGERFYLGASLGTDPGDVASSAVATSDADYIAAFDRDGVLLQTLPVHTWSTSPDTSYSRTVRALASQGDRLVALRWEEAVAEGNDTRLLVYDCANGLSLLAEVEVPGQAGNLQLNHGGSRAALYFPATGEVAEYDLTGDDPSLIARTAGFATDADLGGFLGEWVQPLLQNGPRSRLGREPDRRRYFLARAGLGDAQLRAYRAFSDDPVYTLPLDTLNVGQRYRLISAGPRMLPP